RDHGQPGGQVGQVGGRGLGAEQDEGLAAVLEQAAHSTGLVAGWRDGTERQLIASPVGRLVEAADEIAMKGVLHAEHDSKQAAVAAAPQTGAGVDRKSVVEGK